MIHLALLPLLFPLRPADDVGWLGQTLPAGLKRRATNGEYVLEKTGQVFVYVQGGPMQTPMPTFFNGAPPTPEQVTVKPFYMAKYQVTVAEFRKFATETSFQTDAEKVGYSQRMGFPPPHVPGASWKNPGFSQADNHPVVAISWNDAMKYCAWSGGRLPTNLEFLRAVYFDPSHNRLPQVPFYTQFNLPDFPKGYVNFSDDYMKEVQHIQSLVPWHLDGYVYTAPVDAFPKGGSAYGVMDVGNVAECGSDVQRQHAPNLTDGHFVNGGSYQLSQVHTAPFRFQNDDAGMLDVGFRLVISGVGS